MRAGCASGRLAAELPVCVGTSSVTGAASGVAGAFQFMYKRK
ncbi:hypothetical protein BRYFOR_07903 [Marvinbryantia formatexigens DSM 14469]|uniref:Uncharacterized protein n=1 Tax=Marvinbryantia formatexigens DSM 14469 TaxID=478749 RepID=C6LGZ3_9FIRM|nr:hypothetical protein BRYFOR_07903 [Marvinbryantia formatexigens DSM 14469]